MPSVPKIGPWSLVDSSKFLRRVLLPTSLVWWFKQMEFTVVSWKERDQGLIGY